MNQYDYFIAKRDPLIQVTLGIYFYLARSDIESM